MTPQLEHKHGPSRHHVHIHINGGGFMYARPDGQNAATIVVRKGDHVTWRCDHGNYSVLFKNHSPFADVAFHGRRGNETVTALVVGEAGSYHYAVTVALDSGLIVDDPEIIVGDGDLTNSDN
jgi:plastocyanin